METVKSKRQYAVSGGKTIIGKIFAYQEKTGMPIQEIMKMPYIMFIIGMLDAPSIDYDKENKKEKEIQPETANDEAASLTGFLG